jgi:hypothetical protein
VPQLETSGTREWDTNPGGQNRALLTLLAVGVGGAAMGAANMGAASAASGMAAGEGAMVGPGLSSVADLTGGVAATGVGAAAPAAAAPAGGSWGLVDSGALGAAAPAASGGSIVDRALSFLNTPLGNTVVSGALKLAGGALTPNETAMRLNAEEKVRQDNLNRIRQNTNVAGLNFDKIPANSPRAALRKPGIMVSVPSFDAFKVKAPTAPGLVGSTFKL